MRRSYQRQQLAAYAAGYINAAGTTTIGIGCSMTRISVGIYSMILPTGAALQNRETFTYVTVKGTTPAFFTVEDENDFQKSIYTFNTSASAADTEIEVSLYHSTAN
jgi:hypothetical protein